MRRKKSHEDGYVEEQKVSETGQHKKKGYREKKRMLLCRGDCYVNDSRKLCH